MGFDWMSFATGFLEKTAEIQEERREEAKDFEKEQRDAAERNIQNLSRRRAFADQVTGYSNYLKSQGFTDAQVQAVIASGPRQIEQIAGTVQQAVAANNNRPLTATEVEALFSMPEGFVPLDVTVDEYVDRTFGLSAPEAAAQPEQQPFNLMDRIFGRDQMSRAEARLNRTPVFEGMTIQQVNEAARRGDYTSLQPGTFATFAGTGTRYGPEDQSDFLDRFDSILDDLEDNPEYNALMDQEGKTQQQIEAERRAMQIAIVDPYITAVATSTRDPQDFMDAHEAQLRIRLGDEYVDQLRIELGIDTPEVETEIVPTGSETGAGGEDATPTAIPTEVPTTQLPEQTPIAPPASETDVDERDTPPETEPDAQATVTQENGQTYTFAEWQQMSRTEREEAGLPTSPIGGQWYFRRFGVGLGIVEPDQRFPGRPTEDTVAAPVMPEAATPSVSDTQQAAEMDVAQTLIEDYNVDEGDIQLLTERGVDIILFAESIGVTAQSPLEEIEAAIARFAGERQIGLPKDLTFAARALRSGMQNMPTRQYE